MWKFCLRQQAQASLAFGELWCVTSIVPGLLKLSLVNDCGRSTSKFLLWTSFKLHGNFLMADTVRSSDTQISVTSMATSGSLLWHSVAMRNKMHQAITRVCIKTVLRTLQVSQIEVWNCLKLFWFFERLLLRSGEGLEDKTFMVIGSLSLFSKIKRTFCHCH